MCFIINLYTLKKLFSSKISIIVYLVLLSLYSNTLNSQINNENSVHFAQEKTSYYLKTLQKYYSNGEYELHKKYSDSLLIIAKDHNLIKMQVLALTNQAIFYKNRSERLKAIELYHQALELCEQIPEDFRSKIIVLVNMGNIYNDIESYDKSISYLKNVLELLDTYENSDRIRAAALIGLANNYVKNENYQSTIIYAKKAKTLGKKINNEEIVLSAINNISNAHIGLKNYPKAIEINEEAIELSLTNKPIKKRASFLLNNGIAYFHLQKIDTALEYLNSCKILCEEKQLLETQMFAHEYLAKVYEQKGDYKAFVYEQKNYVKLRNKFLKDKKDASNADLSNEILLKSNELAENKQELSEVSRTKDGLLITGIGIILLLIIIFYFSIKRKEKIELKHEDLKAIPEINKTNTTNLKPYQNSSLTSEKRQELKKKIIDFMKEHKPFLNSEMTQSDLAKELGLSSNHFSEVLHYNFNQNFYNFINYYRILEAQKLMMSPDYEDAKVLSIAFDSGFKSKTSFNRAFKNYTSMTPSEFRKKQVKK